MQDAENSAIDYDLNIHDGAVTAVFRLRDSGIRLVGNSIEWRIAGEARRAALSDIRAIRLTTRIGAKRSQVGVTSCQISFRRGDGVTIFGGNARSPDAEDRRARYEAFVVDLHRRLGADDRARISFTAGYDGFRFYFLLIAAFLLALLWIGAAGVTLFGLAKLRFGQLIALPVAGVFVVGLFRLLQLNAPHIYDPASPLASARAGSIGETLRHAINAIRRGMTPAGWRVVSAAGLVASAGIVVAVAAQERVGLFAPGQARLAFDAVLSRTGPRPIVTYVAVTPGELLVETPRAGDKDSSARTDWRASRRTLFGWTEWDSVSGPTDRHPMSMAEDLGGQAFTLERDDVAHLDDLADAAIERAAFGPGSSVTIMALWTPSSTDKPEPRWTIEVEAQGRRIKLYADRAGRLFPATPAHAGPPRIVLTAVAGSAYGLFPASSGTWIRIVDPDQSVRFEGTLQIGESYSVPDIAGLRLQTGKPDGLAVTVDGKSARLPPTNDAGRLDVVLEPQALLTGAKRSE